MMKLWRGYLLVLIGFQFSFLSAELSWKRIGLEGVEVTALCHSLTIFHEGLLIGTKDHGVFMLRGDTLLRVDGGLWSELMDTLVIHSLAAIDRSATSFPCALFYAGTDKGLYAYMTFSGRPNAWVKMVELPQTDVWDLLLKDGILYAATNDNIYRSNVLHSVTHWDTLDVSRILPPGQNAPNFCCLLAAPDSSKTILAGSVSGGKPFSWTGVVRSMDSGDTWAVWNEGWGDSAPSVTALENFRFYGYDRVTCLAGTDDDLYSRQGRDTSWYKWRHSPSGLENRLINDLHSTFYSSQNLEALYAATDSGVYYYKPIWSSLPSFRRMSNGIPPLTVHALESNNGIGADSIFAGIADGLYLYADHDSLNVTVSLLPERTRFSAFPNPFCQTITIFFDSHEENTSLGIYTIEGKEVASRNNLENKRFTWDAASLPNGFYIIKMKVGGKIFKKRVCLMK